MSRPLPGTTPVEGLEFLYIEAAPGETFHQITDAVFAERGELPMPREGGVIEELTYIKLKEGIQLTCVSYRGDIEGWRAVFLAFCRTTGRRYAFVRGDQLVVSDGATPLLADLDIRIER